MQIKHLALELEYVYILKHFARSKIKLEHYCKYKLTKFPQS
jgi:hypothetical protein